MATQEQILQADLAGAERAIRHLIGEQAALTSGIARAKARADLDVAKLKRIEYLAQHPPVPGIPSGIRFPDVSSYQPRVDLAAVHHDQAQTVGSLMVIKATEGLDYIDGYLASRWHGMAEAGIGNRGAYHFLHPGESGAAQAQYMLEAITAGGREIHPQDILICDAEVSDGQTPAVVAASVKAFGGYLADKVPAKRWLYTGGPFAREFELALAPYQGHWLPCYVGDPKPYYVFGTPIAWQFTDGVHGPTPHSVTGIGPCDCSIIL